MIDSIYNLLFRCQHRRTTFPMTPVRKKTAVSQSEAPAETYVVCLDCGKQFIYDWENMRLGGAVDISDGAVKATETPQIPFRTKSKIRYLLWGSAVSAAALVLGRAAQSRKHSRNSSVTGQHHAETDNIENPKNTRTP